MQNLETLQRKIEDNFNFDELEDLAFSIDAKWDDIPGQRLKDKARELILHMQRRKGLPRLIEALQAERPHTNWLDGTDKDAPCPYRGLHAFREEDEHLFFGRSTLADRLFTAAKTQNFVTVLGPSGSGKSSVVMAGLLPRLRQENRWLVATFRPGSQPFRALAMSLLPLLYPNYSKLDLMDEEDKLVNRLPQNPGSLQQVIEWILREHEPGTKLLLVADQFEELYTLCQDRELRHTFLDQLLTAIAANTVTKSSHLLLLTLRSDFLGQFQNDHAPFVEALQTGTVFMQPMDRNGLRQAIKYPALNAGVEFDATLVERILDDVAQQPGQLPLLEFALSLLWERRENDGISHAAYEAISRVKGALAQYADEVYARLTESEQEQTRFIFLKLVQTGEGTEDTRRLARKAEIGEERWLLVTQLADARLIVTGQNETGEETAEIIHEALIWGWQKLQDWVDNDRRFLTWYKQLRHVHRQWQDNGQDERDLLRGTILDQSSTWLFQRTNDFTDEEVQFIQTSFEVSERDQQLLTLSDMYVSTVSHELRTPMTTIKGYADLLAMGAAGPLQSQQIDFINIIRNSAERLSELINDLLDISRIESHRVHLELKETNLHHLVEQATESMLTSAQEKNLELTITAEPNLPLVMADWNRLTQVMINLLDNAIVYTKLGGVYVSIKSVADEVLIEVRDTGIGIPADALPHIFDRFYRVGTSNTQAKQGGGLGLAIVKAIVEMHQGEIFVKSELGVGSTFILSLPVPHPLQPLTTTQPV